MNISERRRQDIYSAIYDAITDARVKLAKRGLSAKDDHVIAQAVEPAFRGVLEALGAEEA